MHLISLKNSKKCIHIKVDLFIYVGNVYNLIITVLIELEFLVLHTSIYSLRKIINVCFMMLMDTN